MNSEPSSSDIAAVNEFMGGTPAPQPVQQEQPVAQPQAQPAESQPQAQVDPFESYVPPAPVEAVAPPANPQPVEAQQPVQPAQPQAASQPQEQAPQYQSFDDYMKSVMAGLPSEEEAAQAPKLEDINQDDPLAIQQFFSDWGKAIREETINEIRRETRIQDAERAGWDEAMVAFPSLRSRPGLRDMVHNIRMGEFAKGIAMTPKQAAERLVKELRLDYRQGMTDSQIQTTIQQTQPLGGNGVEVIPQSQGTANLSAAAADSEAALVDALQVMIQDGKL